MAMQAAKSDAQDSAPLRATGSGRRPWGQSKSCAWDQSNEVKLELWSELCMGSESALKR
jgi:hypothetical protein